MGERRDFKFGTFTYLSKSHPADEKSSLKGAWSGSGDPILEIYTPCKISATANARDSNFFLHGSAMRSLSLVMSKSSLSGRGQGHVSNFYMDLENFETAIKVVGIYM